uniref:uncharacterized protein LOC114676173 n=1 Tax=Macaca mulatta TaxID=9544 RepID=UPI0010A26B20|nr:uncharacterized protein LOC114676173 [Macaca mulatta]
MPLSGDASGLAEEVQSPTRSPHAHPPTPTALLPAAPDVGARARAGISAAAREGRGPGRAAPTAHARLLRTRRARPPRRAARPLAPAPGRLCRAGLGRAGRTRAPRSPAEAEQARHKLPGALAEAPAPGPRPPPLRRRPAVYLQVAAFVLEILEPLVVQFLVVRHGRAGDSFPRPGPAGSAPTTAPHRHSQEPGRRLSCCARRAAASFLLSPASAAAFSSPRPPPRPNPSATAAPAKTTVGPGGGNGGGMCCRLRGGGSLDLRAPELRPRPSPPAQLAHWPTRLRCVRPMGRGDGEPGRKERTERGSERRWEEPARGREGCGWGRQGRTTCLRRDGEEATEKYTSGETSKGKERPGNAAGRVVLHHSSGKP